jgi:hypothetical protein
MVTSIREWHPELNTTTTTKTVTRTAPQQTTTRRSYRGRGESPHERAEEIK